jgi:hypothetical protein
MNGSPDTPGASTPETPELGAAEAATGHANINTASTITTKIARAPRIEHEHPPPPLNRRAIDTPAMTP